MRGVVTGGAGFLGSHVADVLSERGHEVTVADLVDSGRHRTRIADLMDPDALRAAFEGAEFICHLAAVGDVYLAAERPALAAQVNVTGTANVCEAAIAAGVPKVIYASTWEVYGRPRYEPLDEDHPCEPDHPYNITKLAGERVALSYRELRGLNVAALRLGTAYGTRMRSNSVFSIFIRKGRAREPITIQGTGQQGRQFTHARDIGDAFARALERAESGAVYNVVADRVVTIRELAELVTAELPTEIAYAPARKADVPSASVSSALVARKLGWRPQVEFRAGLQEIIAELVVVAR